MTAAPIPRRYLGLPAPAKINLFLHVVGRRADGYHEIESVFAPVELCDLIDVEQRFDGRIEREGDLTGPPEADLAVRAARLLQAQAPAGAGATLRVEKSIPVGAGLGGGSSDAATTLIALNRLWDLRLDRAQLAALGARLGADVPFFLGTGPAFVQGIGERLTPITLPPAWAVLVFPQVAVSTAEIFRDTKLTRSTKRTTILGFSAALSSGGTSGGNAAEAGIFLPAFGANDLETVACRKAPAVGEALQLLGRHAPARMSGSGSAVFCVCLQEDAARRIAAAVRAQAPAAWLVEAAPLLEELPLAPW